MMSEAFYMGPDFATITKPSDATLVCCAEQHEWHKRPSCDKKALSQTYDLLTDNELQEESVMSYNACLQRELQLSSDLLNSSAWRATLSRYVDYCCKEPQAKARTERVMGASLAELKSPCTAVDCSDYADMWETVFHTWHPWDAARFHSAFETLPTILAFREVLAKNESIRIRIQDTGSLPTDLRQTVGLPPERFVQPKGLGLAKELLAARVMPATSVLLPPAQLLVPLRAVTCMAAVANRSAGQFVVPDHVGSYTSVFELALSNSSGCGNFDYKPEGAEGAEAPAAVSGKCYKQEFQQSHSGRGTLRVLLADHGAAPPGGWDRDWSSMKHIVHEVIQNLTQLVAERHLPSAVVVADVVVGNLPAESQYRSFSEAHIVVGGIGSQLANAICMQPGSHLGAIQLLHYTDLFLWNVVSPFGIQYWHLVGSKPENFISKWAKIGFDQSDELSLKTFMESALVNAATMLVH